MLIQKFHPGIHLGRGQLTSTESDRPLFSKQGHWDGGSALHCVAMALALLGKMADPVLLPFHEEGSERRLWEAAWPHYLHGLTLSELASFVLELNLGVRSSVCTEPGAALLDFIEREVQAERPVILGWSQCRPERGHAALVVGLEGRQSSRRFNRDALLLLDPAGDTPRLTAFNARLVRHKDRRMCYQSSDLTGLVTLEGAVSIRPAPTGAGCA